MILTEQQFVGIGDVWTKIGGHVGGFITIVHLFTPLIILHFMLEVVHFSKERYEEIYRKDLVKAIAKFQQYNPEWQSVSPDSKITELEEKFDNMTGFFLKLDSNQEAINPEERKHL